MADLQRWCNLPLSLMGRCHLICMMGFSRLLYPMQTLPLLLKHLDINRLNSAFIKFIWAGRRPRIALHKLMLSKEEGGINFPNLRSYNVSCLMRHVIDTSFFSNWELESEISAPWPLMSLIHTGFSQLPSHIKHSVTHKDTVSTWKETRKAFGFSFLLSNECPYKGHPEYSHDNYYELKDNGVYLEEHVMHAEDKRWLSPQEVLD